MSSSRLAWERLSPPSHTLADIKVMPSCNNYLLRVIYEVRVRGDEIFLWGYGEVALKWRVIAWWVGRGWLSEAHVSLWGCLVEYCTLNAGLERQGKPKQHGILMWNAAELKTNFVFTVLRNNEGQHWIKRGWVSLKSFIMACEISVTACPFPEDWRRKTWLWSWHRACAVWLWGMCSRRHQVS